MNEHDKTQAAANGGLTVLPLTLEGSDFLDGFARKVAEAKEHRRTLVDIHADDLQALIVAVQSCHTTIEQLQRKVGERKAERMHYQDVCYEVANILDGEDPSGNTYTVSDIPQRIRHILKRRSELVKELLAVTDDRDRLERQCERYKKALRAYADEGNWHGRIWIYPALDGYGPARGALSPDADATEGPI